MELDRYHYLQAKAADLTTYMTPSPYDFLCDAVLEVVPFIQPDDSGSRDGAYRVEFLLECGGPTSTVIVDSRHGVAELWSTDGPKPGESYTYDKVELPHDVSAPWAQLAESIVESER